MAAALLEKVTEKLTPLLQELSFLVPFCPCLETAEMRARKERRAMLVVGAKFTRKKQTFGMNFGASEDVSLKLSDDGNTLHWFVVPAGSGANSGAVELHDVASVGAKSPASLTVMSTTGDLLLELEASTAEGGASLRDAWVTALNEAARAKADSEVRVKETTMADKARKQAYFLQKGVELASKRKENEARKAKYLEGAGGLKFTALAMAGRE